MYDESVSLLQRRGLIVEDKERVKRYLRTIGYYRLLSATIGYYRLSGYFLPFSLSRDQFHTGTKFSDILDLYIFDRKLHLLMMDAMERIEVAVRTTISDILATHYDDPHWFLREDIFFGII
ncbi:MAG: hypothetical protein GQ542_13955, partial [Desulforhopalus sp.]|nr:hypothetical protein [Desulforhopalus sp.]